MASSLFGVALAVAGGGPGALDSATPPFHDCLTHPVGPRADFPLLPLFGYCRNASCVDEAHGQQGGRNRPRTDSSTGERAPLGELHGCWRSGMLLTDSGSAGTVKLLLESHVEAAAAAHNPFQMLERNVEEG